MENHYCETVSPGKSFVRAAVGELSPALKFPGFRFISDSKEIRPFIGGVQ